MRSVEADAQIVEALDGPFHQREVPKGGVFFKLAFRSVFEGDSDVFFARIIQHCGGKIEIGVRAVEQQIGRMDHEHLAAHIGHRVDLAIIAFDRIVAVGMPARPDPPQNLRESLALLLGV